MDRFRLDHHKYERHPDFKEMMVEEIRRENKQMHNRQSNLPDPDSFYGRSDQYIMLDTFRKNPLSDVANGEFIFDLMIQGSTSDYVIGVRERLNNIVEMQIGSFNVPILPQNEYSLTNTSISGLSVPSVNTVGLYFDTTYPQYSSSQICPNQRFTIFVKEASLQSISDKNGKKHHFDMLSTYSTITEPLQRWVLNDADPPAYVLETYNKSVNVYTATPNLDWDTYYFTDPIQDFSTITLQFNNPDINLRFYPDVYYNVDLYFADSTAEDVYNGLDTDDKNHFVVVNIPNHNIPPGSVVIITGLNTSIPQINNYINNVNGLITSNSYNTTDPVFNASDLIYFTPSIVSFDGTPDGSAPSRSYKVNVYVPSRRMRIPMRMRRVIDRTTNFKDV